MNGVNYYVIADNDLQYFLANATTKEKAERCIKLAIETKEEVDKLINRW